MSRITLDDNAMSAIMKMADGNPGAITTMMEIIDKHDSIDPQAMMGGIGAIMILDTWEIYGTDIYILFNDKCDRDVRKMLMLMRATQLGNFSHSKLQQMASDQMRKVNLSDDEWQEIEDYVCDALKDFAKAA